MKEGIYVSVLRREERDDVLRDVRVWLKGVG